jgi:prepilin-type N-terminal cleavage/methylation domain-containing protein
MIKSNKHSLGFTLVELMITIVLSSLFIGGITQVFSRTSQNFRTQRTLSNMMEDARFALDKMNSEFRRTGFLTNKLLPNGQANFIFHNRIAVDYNAGAYTIRNNGDTVPGNLLTMGTNETIRGAINPAGPTSDNVIIRYQLAQNAAGIIDFNSEYSPCTNGFTLNGGNNTDRHVISIVFYMGASVIVNSNVLYCRAYKENIDNPGSNELLAAVPLISNVERLRILYGQTDALDIDVDGNTNETVYRTEQQVSDSDTPATDDAWVSIRSVRISLALRSEESNISVATPGNYTINGQFSIAPTNAGEKRLYRVFSTTAAFRN